MRVLCPPHKQAHIILYAKNRRGSKSLQLLDAQFVSVCVSLRVCRLLALLDEQLNLDILRRAEKVDDEGRLQSRSAKGAERASWRTDKGEVAVDFEEGTSKFSRSNARAISSHSSVNDPPTKFSNTDGVRPIPAMGSAELQGARTASDDKPSSSLTAESIKSGIYIST